MSYTREQRAAKAAAQEVAAPAPQQERTVEMVRDSSTNRPPYRADVHPDEVDNYRAHGWQIANG